jgi:hypothetical protein
MSNGTSAASRNLLGVWSQSLSSLLHVQYLAPSLSVLLSYIGAVYFDTNFRELVVGRVLASNLQISRKAIWPELIAVQHYLSNKAIIAVQSKNK